MKQSIILILITSSLYAYNPGDTLSTKSSNSLVIRIEDFQYESGLFLSHWINQEYGLRFGFSAYYSSYESQNWMSGNYTTQEDIRLSPTIGIVKRFITRANVAPYFGFESQITWYIKNGTSGKYTVLKPSFVFGVEAFVTDYFSISGEQLLTTSIYLNDSRFHNATFGEGMLSASFYF